MPLPARLCALLLFLAAGLSLRLRFDLSLAAEGGDVGATLWRMTAFFTVLTNLALTLAMAAVALRWRIPAGAAAALLLSMAAVGIVYHALLARLWSPEGATWWADFGLHTVAPLGMALWWAAFAPKDVAWRDLPSWLLWPVAYGLYALARGAATGTWAYPFLNADKHGWGGVALNLAGMAAAFAVLGAAIVLAARRLAPAARGAGGSRG